MAPPKDLIPHVEVDDPAAAMQRAQGLARRVLSLPKHPADAPVKKPVKPKGKQR